MYSCTIQNQFLSSTPPSVHITLIEPQRIVEVLNIIIDLNYIQQAIFLYSEFLNIRMSYFAHVLLYEILWKRFTIATRA